MPESTVGQSIMGALGSIAGISGRRAEDGLTTQRAQELALKNEASRKLLQDDEDAALFGELQDLGYLTVDRATGKASVDAPRLAKENPEAFARLMGPEANRFLSTQTDKGAQPVQFAGVKVLDPRIMADPALGAYPQETGPNTGPSKYVVQLRTQDGSIRPATQNASAAADDTLITLDDDQLNKMVAGRIGRMRARGGLDNNVTMTNLQLAYQEEADALLQSKLADMGTEGLTDDPAVGRSFYGILNDLTGEDLDEAVRDRGLDPEKLRAEALDAWTKKQAEIRKNAVKYNTEDMSAYEGTKEILSRNVSLAEQALADYDLKKSKEIGSRTNIDQAMINASMGERGMHLRPTDKKAPQAKAPMDQIRYKLEKERNAAADALANLKPPKAATNNAPLPPFEWNEDKLREMVRGKIPDFEPSPEQTAALTKYAKDNGVQSAQDLAKLPDKNHAMALAGIIAMNARGATPEQKIAIFDKLANYARTGDSSKSPLQAKLDITGRQVDQAQAINQGRAVDASIANSQRDSQVALMRLGLDIDKFEYDKNKDVWAKGKDIDAANNKVREYTDKIYKGTLGEGNKIQAPTPEAMTAWKNLSNDVRQLPQGTPQQIAASASYLEGFFQMAAASSVTPGQAAWWDVPKIIANTFMREDGMVNMSPLIETARIEYANGQPVRVSFTDHGATGKETKLVVGADEFKRFTGSSDFSTFVNAVHSQQATNMLQAANIPVTEKNVAEAISALRKNAGMK